MHGLQFTHPAPTHLYTDDVTSPSEVELSFLNISSVLITWTYPLVDHTHFIVQRSRDGDAYQNISSIINSTHYVSIGMKFAAYYQFRIIAIVKGVASPPTETNFFINGITGKLFRLVKWYIPESSNRLSKLAAEIIMTRALSLKGI